MSRSGSSRNITDWFRPKLNSSKSKTLKQVATFESQSSRDTGANIIPDPNGSGPNKRQRIDKSTDFSPYRTVSSFLTTESDTLRSDPLPSPTSSTSNHVTASPHADQNSSEVLSTPIINDDSAVVIGEKAFMTGSSSSFSSLRSSQPSKRVIERGEEVVKGSDSDTDGSESELEDLNAILGKPKVNKKPTPSNVAASTATKPNKISTSFLSLRKKERKKDLTKKHYGAFDVTKLVEEKEQEVAMEVRIAMAESDLNEAQDTARLSRLQRTPRKDMIRAALIETADDDTGKARRVMEALDRTEAFEQTDVWRFFTNAVPTTPRTSFPKIVHKIKSLATILNDPARREQAFLTGYIQRVVNFTELPDELMAWMMDEVCKEPNQYLVYAYLETLQRGLPDEALVISPDKLRSCFRSVGARDSHADDPILHASEALNVGETVLSSNLPSFVHALGQLSHKMSIASKDAAVHFLVRGSIDNSVLSNPNLVTKIGQALTLILDSYPIGPESENSHTRLANELYTAVRSPLLRYQLISALPRTTLSAHMLRRRLALAFTLDNTKYLNKPLEKRAITAHIHVQLYNNPAFLINPSTDYLELKARLLILDAALDSGFSDFLFLEEGDRAAEKQFNQDVDNLATAVRDLMVKIVDVGAAHMRRTECKGAADRLLARLENAVRTKPKPGRRWLEDIPAEQGNKPLTNWIVKALNASMAAPEIDDIPPEDEVEVPDAELNVEDEVADHKSDSTAGGDTDRTELVGDKSLEAQSRPSTPTTPRAPRIEIKRAQSESGAKKVKDLALESMNVVPKLRLLR